MTVMRHSLYLLLVAISQMGNVIGNVAGNEIRASDTNWLKNSFLNLKLGSCDDQPEWEMAQGLDVPQPLASIKVWPCEDKRCLLKNGTMMKFATHYARKTNLSDIDMSRNVVTFLKWKKPFIGENDTQIESKWVDIQKYFCPIWPNQKASSLEEVAELQREGARFACVRHDLQSVTAIRISYKPGDIVGMRMSDTYNLPQQLSPGENQFLLGVQEFEGNNLPKVPSKADFACATFNLTVE